jgi:hypothetical protein
MVELELPRQRNLIGGVAQQPTQCDLLLHSANPHLIVDVFDGDLIAGLDPETVPYVLWQDNLSLGPNLVSHTNEYNS